MSNTTTVTVTKTQILIALNRRGAYILALVEVTGQYSQCRCLRQPFETEPDESDNRRFAD